MMDLMVERIHNYFRSLGLDDEEAESLHMRYYKEYGLAIRGLVQHHAIDPLDYDQKCDASLPLEEILRPDTRLIGMLKSLKSRKTSVFSLTNAYRVHARRVLSLLQLDSIVEGIVYCDYTNPAFSCKPEAEFYLAAQEAVHAAPTAQHYFVDDSIANVRQAIKLGWSKSVHYDEHGDFHEPFTTPDGILTISHLLQLPTVWPELFS